MPISAPELELLLADIRDAFAEKMEASSADLVKALVALEGRPWGSGNPLTQNRLARMLRPLGISPDMIGAENARQRGYKLWQFEEAFSRYLPPETVQNVANTGNGSGLSSREIAEFREWVEDQAYRAYSSADIAAGKLDAALRAKLGTKVSPERVEIELERVMKEVRGAR